MNTQMDENNENNDISEDSAARMTFTGHLGELRTRMIRCTVLFLVIAVVGYIGSNSIYEAVKTPLENAEGLTWVSMTLIEPILVKFKIAFYTALIVGLPYIVYEICAFVFPGLKPRERRVVKFALFCSAALGLFGMLTAFFVVFPFVVPYFVKMAPEGLLLQLRYTDTITHLFKGVMGFAIAFQFPIVVLVLVYLGVVSPRVLKEQRKPAILGIFVCCAILTPPDPITLLLMAFPLLILFEMSIWASHLVYRGDDEEETS